MAIVIAHVTIGQDLDTFSYKLNAIQTTWILTTSLLVYKWCFMCSDDLNQFVYEYISCMLGKVCFLQICTHHTMLIYTGST